MYLNKWRGAMIVHGDAQIVPGKYEQNMQKGLEWCTELNSVAKFDNHSMSLHWRYCHESPNIRRSKTGKLKVQSSRSSVCDLLITQKTIYL